MKQTMKPFLLSAVILLLAGCLGDISNEVDEGRTEYQPNQVDVQTTTNQLANNYYRAAIVDGKYQPCLLYTSPSPRDRQKSRMPSSA